MFSGRGTRIGWGDCYEHHLPPYKLEAAAKQNCYVCTRLWKALSPNEQKLVRNTLGIIGNGYRWRWFTLLLDRLWCCDWMEGCYGWNCDFGQNRLYFMFGAPGPHRKRVAFDLLHADGPYQIPRLLHAYNTCRSIREKFTFQADVVVGSPRLKPIVCEGTRIKFLYGSQYQFGKYLADDPCLVPRVS